MGKKKQERERKGREKTPRNKYLIIRPCVQICCVDASIGRDADDDESPRLNTRDPDILPPDVPRTFHGSNVRRKTMLSIYCYD